MHGGYSSGAEERQLQSEEEKCVKQHPQCESRRALHRWAANFVSSVTSRSRTLVNRVLHTDSQNLLIHDPSVKDSVTAGLEKWAQKNYGVDQFSSSVYEGLNGPVWREAKNLDNSLILESCPYEVSKSHSRLPDGVSNIQTTVWYGVKSKTVPRQHNRKEAIS